MITALYVFVIQLLQLTEDDMNNIDAIHKKPGMHRSLLRYHINSPDGMVFGWTYEQMGWNMAKGGIIVE